MIKQMLFAICCFSSAFEPNSNEEIRDDNHRIYSEWELDRNSGGVKTFTRWIEQEGSDKVRERKGEMVLNCTVEDVVKLLCNSENTALWMSGIKENYCLKQVNLSEWYTYTLFDIPWPFEKRDLISNCKMESTVGGKKVTILISSREDYLPEKSHISRLKDYTATWTVVGITGNKVTISFSAIANTPPMFPRFIQDPILAKMFHDNLVTLKKMLDT